MGVEFGVSTGYGFGDMGKAENFHPLLNHLGLPSIEPELEELEQRFRAAHPLLILGIGGNQWSGEQHWTINVATSVKHFGGDDESTPNLHHLTIEPSGAALEDLLQLHATLGLTHDSHPVGWMVSVNHY